ncbi:MAG: helix-turn-helix domain-containing protein [Clostridia bacterium]|nr:helix-turn-helix domain-containing protein [Clostridia bacterium]
MKERVHLPTVLSVDTINSVYHFSLEGRKSKGELHDFYELVFVESGFYYVILDGERIVVPPGSCIFFAPNAFHSGDGVTRSTATVSIVSFDCTSPAMRCFDNRVFAPDEAQRRQLSAFFDAALAACEKSPHGGLRARDGVPPHRLQMLRAQLEFFLLGLYTEGEHRAEPSNRRQYKKECFARLSNYMKANLSARLTLSDLAVACSMSESTVKSLCREFCDCGPTEYLISLRIVAAKTMIRESTLNFTEIAEVTGFGTLHYFSRVFKERTGITPTDYAKAP